VQAFAGRRPQEGTMGLLAVPGLIGSGRLPSPR
jgi:hypothetical protein